MSKEEMFFWLSWCVEEYSEHKHQSTLEISSLFDTKQVYEYLEENADILHTQGKNYILGSIDEFISHH